MLVINSSCRVWNNPEKKPKDSGKFANEVKIIFLLKLLKFQQKEKKAFVSLFFYSSHYNFI